MRPVLCTAGVVPDGTRGDLLDEVANLVESPTVVLGGFDPAFLDLPRWAGRYCQWYCHIVSAMSVQRQCLGAAAGGGRKGRRLRRPLGWSLRGAQCLTACKQPLPLPPSCGQGGAGDGDAQAPALFPRVQAAVGWVGVGGWCFRVVMVVCRGCVGVRVGWWGAQDGMGVPLKAMMGPAGCRKAREATGAAAAAGRKLPRGCPAPAAALTPGFALPWSLLPAATALCAPTTH
jgi:hypothetical protein